MVCFKCIEQNNLNHPVSLFLPEADAIGSFIILLSCVIPVHATVSLRLLFLKVNMGRLTD